MQKEKELPIFVYGTLRPGEKNYSTYLGGMTLREVSAQVEGQLYFVKNGGYPYLLPEKGRVIGELIYLKPDRYTEVLTSLDRLEEYDEQNESNSVYLRRRTSVIFEGTRRAEAWVYYWNEAAIKGERIESGDFKKRNRAL